MNPQSFSLQPFPGSAVPEIEIFGSIARQLNQLTVQYLVLGDLDAIAIEPLAETPERRHGLWEHTCFELFVGLAGTPRYWEFNLSPARHWNVYRFESYRDQRSDELEFMTFPFRIDREVDSFAITFTQKLPTVIFPANHAFEIGITAVIQTKTNEFTYWALTHCASEPDFHKRESFTIQL